MPHESEGGISCAAPVSLVTAVLLQPTRLQQFLTRIIEELRASGLPDEQIVSVFKNAAEDFAADTVERVEKREGRKLSDEEIEEISEDANTILVETLGLEQ